MEIRKEFPPNIEEIRRMIEPPDNAIFPYGNIIYNPSGQEIFPDIIFHEEIHGKQQKDYASPEIWWNRWLADKSFRLEEEIEAFAKQVKFVKDNLGTKAGEGCLEECANKLSNNYRLDITYHQSHTAIRKYIKK